MSACVDASSTPAAAVSCPCDPGRTTLAVLAGGEGSRMGTPKGLLQILGRPILHHLLDSMRWPGPTLLVTAPGKGHPPAWQEFDREVSDPVSGSGPLRGILTALETAQTTWVIFATVDMPAIGFGQLAWLAQQAQGQPNLLGVMLRRSDGGSELIEPFPLFLNREAITLVRERFHSGRRSIQGLRGDPRIALSTAPADWPGSVWTNLNRREDLDAYLRCLGSADQAADPSRLRQQERNANMSSTDEVTQPKAPGVFKQFVAKFPELGEAHESIAKAVESYGPLDAKTLELVKIGLSVGAGLESATRAHVRKAMAHGATQTEIEQAILLAYNTCGWPRTVAAWQWAQQQFERGI